MKKDYLKNSNQLGKIVTEMLLLNREKLIENILSGKEKKEIFEEVYQKGSSRTHKSTCWIKKTWNFSKGTEN